MAAVMPASAPGSSTNRPNGATRPIQTVMPLNHACMPISAADATRSPHYVSYGAAVPNADAFLTSRKTPGRESSLGAEFAAFLAGQPHSVKDKLAQVQVDVIEDGVLWGARSSEALALLAHFPGLYIVAPNGTTLSYSDAIQVGRLDSLGGAPALMLTADPAVCTALRLGGSGDSATSLLGLEYAMMSGRLLVHVSGHLGDQLTFTVGNRANSSSGGTTKELHFSIIPGDQSLSRELQPSSARSRRPSTPVNHSRRQLTGFDNLAAYARLVAAGVDLRLRDESGSTVAQAVRTTANDAGVQVVENLRSGQYPRFTSLPNATGDVASWERFFTFWKYAFSTDRIAGALKSYTAAMSTPTLTVRRQRK